MKNQINSVVKGEILKDKKKYNSNCKKRKERMGAKV
jgi:hypothetical protein